jgi:hypothetical protein
MPGRIKEMQRCTTMMSCADHTRGRRWKKRPMTPIRNICSVLRSKRRPFQVEKAYLRRTVPEDIDGVVNVMLGSLIDAIIVVSVSGVH